MVVLLRLLIATVQTAMLLSNKLIVLIAVLNLTGQSFAWLSNKLRLLQISNAVEIYIFLRSRVAEWLGGAESSTWSRVQTLRKRRS